MVNRAAGEQQGRFQRVMFQNMLVLLSLSIVLCTVIYIKLFESGLTAFDALSTTIVILIACIPIAMQVVSTTVMAVGGRSAAVRCVGWVRVTGMARTLAAYFSPRSTVTASW